jgi:hypothetical protein
MNSDSQVFAASMYETAVLADGPVAYYRLNENSGTTAANIGSGVGIDGTYDNIPGMTANNMSNYGVPGPRPSSFPGLEADNNSIFLDPENGSVKGSTTNPMVKVVDPNSPLVITGALTLEAWIKRSDQLVDAGNNEGIVGRYRQDQFPGTTGDQGARSYVLYFDSTTNPDNSAGTPGLGVAYSTSPTGAFQSANSYEFSASLPVGEWVHVAAVLDPGNRVEVYVNGSSIGEVTTGVLTDPLFSGPGDFWIGQQFTEADEWTFEGGIDEVAVYAKALTDEQVLAHYQAAVVPEPACWQLAMLAWGALIGRRRRCA